MSCLWGGFFGPEGEHGVCQCKAPTWTCGYNCELTYTHAGIGAGFYLYYSWAPSFFNKHVGIPQSLTVWMVLTGMVVFTFVVPVSAGCTELECGVALH